MNDHLMVVGAIASADLNCVVQRETCILVLWILNELDSLVFRLHGLNLLISRPLDCISSADQSTVGQFVGFFAKVIVSGKSGGDACPACIFNAISVHIKAIQACCCLAKSDYQCITVLLDRAELIVRNIYMYRFQILCSKVLKTPVLPFQISHSLPRRL